MDLASNPYLSGIKVLQRNSDGGNDWVAPNSGRYPVSHVTTFMNQYTSLAHVYRDYDESLIDSRENARFMMLNLGIRECLDSRRRSVALLNYHIAPEDDKSPHQIEFCQLLEKVVNRIKNFQQYRESMQFGIWFGKQGCWHRFLPQVFNGKSIYVPKGLHPDDNGWRPLHGDKIVFRQSRPLMVPGAYEGQMGVRVGWLGHQPGQVVNQRWRLEATDYGLAYFLNPAERRLMLIHKHHPYDASFEDGLRAGSIHGLGIRSIVYWEWKQATEIQAFLVEYLERMAGGIQIWKYPMGNRQAEAKAREAAENYNSGHEHIMLVPVPIGEAGNQYGVDVVEPGFQGIETIQHLIKDYFNDRVKRYILGQKLSSEAEATGMGSGVAELHMDTLLQIIKSDATAHEETLTDELLGAIIKVNVDKKVWHDPGFRPRFVCETEESDIDKKSEVVLAFMGQGIKFRLPDIYDLVGMAQPGPDDEVNPDAPQGAKPGEAGLPKPDAKTKESGDPKSPSERSESIKDGEDSTARDDNAANNGHAASHIQRYSRRLPFSVPSGWKRRPKTGK